MEADRQRCLDAGMNDHVAKPIEPKTLFETLLRWIPAKDRGARSKSPSDVNRAVTVSPSNGFEDLLKGIDELDIEAGLQRVMNKRDLYRKLLLKFATGPESQTVEMVKAHLAKGESKAAERAAHSLKGVAGTLGAGSLQEKAGGLEAAIRAGESERKIESYLVAVEEALLRLISSIKKALPPDEAPDVTAPFNVDWDQARDIVSRLETLLSEHDAGAIELYKNSASILRAALGEATVSVEDSLTSWDFSSALEALRAAKEDCENLQ
jgi:two-component system sensor histidine kinase/response regulator